MADLYDDLRYSLRALIRSPAVAFILIGSLAVGTGDASERVRVAAVSPG